MRDAVAEAAKHQQGSSSKRTTVASLMNSGLNTVAAAATGNQTKYTKLSVGNIDSPLHGLTTPNGTDCFDEDRAYQICRRWRELRPRR